MASVLMSPIAMIVQLLSDQGIVGAGFKINTYVGGSVNTPQQTFTDSTGLTPNSNPIIMGSNGRFQNVSVWAVPGTLIKMVVQDANNNTIAGLTIDNIPLINDAAVPAGFAQTQAEINAGVTPTNTGYLPGDFRRYGAVGDGSTDDTTAITNAFKTGQLVLGGGPAFSYKYASNVTIPAGVSIRFDGQGCAMKPAGSAAIVNTNVSPAATTTVSSGATQGSISCVVASAASLVVGQIVQIGAANFPTMWGRIKGIAGTTITLDCAFPETYSGTINFTAWTPAALYQAVEVRNVTFDGSLFTTVPSFQGQCFRFVNFISASAANVEVKNFAVSSGSNLAVFMEWATGCALTVSNCRLHDNPMGLGAGVTCCGIEADDVGLVSVVNNAIEGSHFGCNITRPFEAIFSGNVLRGQRTYESSIAGFGSNLFSVRGIKISSAGTASIASNQIDDYSTPIRIDVGFRVQITGNSIRNQGFVSGTNNTDAAIECTVSGVANQYGMSITGNVIENAGGHGILINNNALAANPIRCVIADNYIDSCQGFAMNLLGVHAIISGNYIKDWDLSAANTAAIGNTGAANVPGGFTATGNVFEHTTVNTKPWFTSVGPTGGSVNAIDRTNRSPTGNPIFGAGFGSNGLQEVANATIPNGATSVTITHHEYRAPTADEIYIFPTAAATNAPGLIWVSGLTSTQFTVNCANNPGASGLLFTWAIILKQPYTVT